MSMHSRGRARGAVRTVFVRAVLGALLLVALVPTSPASSVTLVQDPERNSTSLTGWAWYHGVSASTLSSAISAGGLRIIDLEVESATGPTFSAALVKNTGTYARTWWWYVGLTGSQVSSYLALNNGRLIDLEAYATASGVRFAVVMVKNTGSAAKAWWWYRGVSTSYISSKLTANGARLIDLERYTSGGTTVYAAVMIKNAGVDAKSWWWYLNRTGSQVASLLSTNHARLIDIERTSATTFNVIMVRGSGESWWWYYGKTASSVVNLASQNGARIVDLEPYYVSGVKYFAVVLINDVNAETTRIRNLVSAKLSGANWGFYLKRVGSSNLLELQPDRIFEPASMTKIVHAITALRDAMDPATATTLTTNITWYANPAEPARYPSDPDYANPDGTLNDPADKDVCAYNDAGTLLTGATYSDELGAILIKQMLRASDNRTTDGLTRKYGFAALNAMEDYIGMTRSQLYHRIGCSAASSPQPWRHNELTLRDAGRVYEKAQNGTLLGTGLYRDKWYEYLAGGTLGSGSESSLANLIRSVGASGGLTTTQINSFLANTRHESKGGGYTMCPDSGACNPKTLQVSTVGGIVFLPFKDGRGTIVPRAYVYGRFINSVVACSFAQIGAATCSAWNTQAAAMNTVGKEMFRQVVSQAVATW